ncbi:MAG: hypothetical protein QNJ90_16520 [Planctomycetota bacterium]|nr:hypothetical protein [Planctomycetota bacterium]
MRGPRRRYARWACALPALVLLLGLEAPAYADDDSHLPPPQIIVRKGKRRPPPPAPAAPVRPTPRAPAPTPRQPVDDLPFLPPERPQGPPEIRPGDVTFDVARPGGLLRLFPDGPADSERAVLVMLGNPRIHRPAHVKDGKEVEALTIKANTMVAWVDRRGFPEADAFSGLSGAASRGVRLEPSASVIPDFLEGIYAEGAVQLEFGDLTFRAQSVYIEPKTYKALLVEPRFDGRSIGIQNSEEPLPLHVRARRARLVAKGLTVFDDGEISASRADDRIALKFKTITVEELNDERDEQGVEKPHALGYQADSSQWYSGRSLTLQGERVPFFWLPRVDFGLSKETEALTSPVKRVRTGRKSEVGRFGFVRLGTQVGDRADPLFDLFFEGGGYLKRGWAGGVDVAWDHQDPEDAVKGFGRVHTWAVFDNRSFDSDGFRADEDVRGRITAESRTWLRPDLYLDVEFNTFSDRGFNNEFFERDDLHHKDRESYARLRYAPASPGNVVGTLDLKWQQRPWVTETAELPQAGVWITPAPLLVPQRRGGLSVDITSVAKAGYLGRRFDEDTAFVDYEAWRLHTDTRLNAAANVGDVRLSAYVGGAGTVYEERTDGLDDLTRTALLAGVRANLQLHKTSGMQGGLFELDGLRHIIDIDAELAGRFWDSHGPGDVPFFDAFDAERERSAAILRLRNRWQTRRRGPAGAYAGMRTVGDLELALKGYLDEKGPYGLESPGAFEVTFFGQPREHLDVSGELTVDFDDGVQTASFGSGIRTTVRDRPFRIFGGVRYVRERSTSLSLDASWRFSEKYGLRFLEVIDFEDGEDLSRVLFRRYSDDHVIVFGLSVRNGEDLNLEFSIEPAIGGVSTEGPQAFKDEPDPDPWGTFLR